MLGHQAGPAATWLCALRAGDGGAPDADATDDWAANATQIVQAHGGGVSAASAQALTAHFIAGSGPADHAEQGLRCAQTLLAQARAQATPRGLPGSPSLRLGLHSGWLGGAGQTDPLLHAQRAAAVAGAAPPGRLCIEHRVAARLHGLIDVEPVQPLRVAGHAARLQVCLLLEAGPRMPWLTACAAEAPTAALVGRQDDMRSLQQTVMRAVAAGRASMVTLLADPGIGKSRLLREFDRWAHAQPLPWHSLRARATPQTQDQPFGLLRQLVFAFCQIEPHSGSGLALSRLEQAVMPWFMHDEGAELAEAHAHLLAHLIGIDLAHSRHLPGLLADPAPTRQKAMTAVARLLRRLGAGGATPVLLLIEDLHWADDASLDCLAHLLNAESDLALLIVSTSRATLAERRPAWTRSAGACHCITLGPLDPLRSRELAAALLKDLPEIPRALLDLVVACARGQPYAIEERIKLLIDQGVVVACGSGWEVDLARLRQASLPDTLDGVLRARLALLPAAERRTLQRASVIGPVFGADALLSLGRRAGQSMPALLLRDMATRGSVAGEGGALAFNFKHQLLQDLVYRSLAPRTRRALHARFAAWLLSIGGAQATEMLAQTAHHFEQAGDPTQAAEQHARAAEHAHLRYASAAVMDHAQRGLALLDRLPASPRHQALRWRLLKARIRMLQIVGQQAQHRADIDALIALAEELDDDTRRADALLSSTLLSMFTADAQAMKASARQAMGCAARAGDHGLRLTAMRLFASAHFRLGDWDAGQRLAHQCLVEARERGLREVEAFCTNLLGIIASRQRDPVAGLRWDEQTLAAWRALGDHSQEAISVCNIGESWLELGDPTLARHHLEEGARLARACGHQMAYSAALSNLSVLERRLGNAAQAVALAGLAARAAVATGAPDLEAIALQQLGEAELLLGHPAAAVLAFEAIEALALQHALPPPPDPVAGLAAVALAQGDVPTALRQVLRLLALDAAGGVALRSLNPRRLALICHCTLSNAGDPRALAWLQRAHAELLEVAATISDAALRDGFLNNIPDHRAILAAWELHLQAP